MIITFYYSSTRVLWHSLWLLTSFRVFFLFLCCSWWHTFTKRRSIINKFCLSPDIADNNSDILASVIVDWCNSTKQFFCRLGLSAFAFIISHNFFWINLIFSILLKYTSGYIKPVFHIVFNFLLYVMLQLPLCG